MEYQRPQGYRFAAGGVNVKSAPDSIPPNKYAAGQNVRWISDQSVLTRAGWVELFAGGSGQFTDIKAYATLETDDVPVFLARDTSNNIVLSNSGAPCTTMAGATGWGASMISFRPSASPQPWMYVATVGDYRKISAPQGNAVQVFKVGVAEPQFGVADTRQLGEVMAACEEPAVVDFTGTSGDWVGSGSVTGSLTDVTAINYPQPPTTTWDTVGIPLADPAKPDRLSIATGSGSLAGFMVNMLVNIGGRGNVPVQELRPAIPTTTVAAITYYAGSPGMCQIVPTSQQLGGLDRGSIVKLGSGYEYVLVLDVITGNGGVSFECVTGATISVGDAIQGAPAFIINGAAATNDQIVTWGIHAQLGTGTVAAPNTGVLSQTFGSTAAVTQSPFIGFTQDDYVHAIIGLATVENLVSVTLNFDLGGYPAFTNVASYSLTGAELAAIFPGPWAALMIPISSLSNVQGGALDGCTGVQVVVTTGGYQEVTIGSIFVRGAFNPDIGQDGVPYRYRMVPRNSLTGAQGNPSPDLRYGVRPRRQRVWLIAPDSSYDVKQIDTWDVYRYGGSVTSFRYIGSCNPGSDFIDNVTDAYATAGQAMPTENFEPWPSIDVPWTSGGTATVVGSVIQVSGSNPLPATIAQWLPGTLIQVVGGNVYTLRWRPVGPSGTSVTFYCEESGGSASGSGVYVNEPNVARQILPYLWGPDENGVVFGCGDPLRPGTVYFAQANAPDEAPDTNTMELCPPSEPLLGGRAVNGVSYVASSNRWWALYPSFQTTVVPYYPLAQPVGRAPVAPYGITDDGVNIYFWAKDCIAMTSGGQYTSLTDDDLRPLFPTEGEDYGNDVTRCGVTYAAPDYRRCAQFRLTHSAGFLYADYPGFDGNYHTLVCDLRTKSWVTDNFKQGAAQMTCHYAAENQAGTLTQASQTPAPYPRLVMGDSSGIVYTEVHNVGDNGGPIDCVVGTFESDGGDQRAQGNWGDLYVDALPLASAGIIVTPVSQGAEVASATTIPNSPTRNFSVISVGGGEFQKFLGLQFNWTDYASGSGQGSASILYLWQPSFVPQPEIIYDRATDWIGASPGASYYRGVVLTADTFGANKTLAFRSADNETIAATLTINHNGQKGMGYAFNPPFVSHLVRIEAANSTIPWKHWVDRIQWIADPWPELTTQVSAWLNLGTPGTKYMRGLVLPLDTGGASVVLVVVSSDGSYITLPAVTTTAGEKSPTAFSFDVPLVGHEFQIQPQQPCRMWPEEAKWDFEPWPEYITESGPWLNLGTNKAKYMRAMVLPVDTGGNAVVFDFASSDGDLVQMGPVTTTANVKSPMPFAFVTPMIGHEFQIAYPNSPIRIWFDEAIYDFEEWPEFITETGPWMNLGTNKNKYMRGMVLPIETNGTSASFSLQSSDGANILLGPVTTGAGVKTPVPFAFNVPLIGHEFQIHQPSSPMRIWFAEGQYDFEEWPELIAEASPWMNLGNQGAKYLRGCVVPCDTNGAAVSLTFVSSDGGSVTVGPFTTPASEKTDMPWAFTIPLVGHEFQLRPTGAIRVWYDQIRWDYQPWPELITEATGWLPVNGGDAGYLQGFVLPVESGAQPPQLELLTDTGQTIPLTATVTPGLDVKTGVAYSLQTPVTCHYVQIVPLAPCRLWVGEGGSEIKWVTSATPETASTWTTQATSFASCGLNGGFMHIPRIEAVYDSANPVTLQINAFDGISPQPITLPATSGKEKILITPTVNKGLLWQFNITSSAPFQVFGPEFIVWIAPWGRSGPYVNCKNLGGAFTDQAAI